MTHPTTQPFCFDGKVVIITGAAEGIGHGCAEVFAARGASCLLNDRPGNEKLTETATRLRESGADIALCEADVFTREGCQHVLQQALDQWGHVDVLISNPACSIRSPFLEFPADQFEAVVRGTLLGGFHMSQLFAQTLCADKRPGKIVFISSVQAEMPLGHSSAYNAAKAGLNHFARTIAVELAPHRINVNVIEPGWTHTPGEERTFGLDRIAQEGSRLPWGRLGTPEDIGHAAAFLASSEADYITGTVLPVDGAFRYKDCGWDG